MPTSKTCLHQPGNLKDFNPRVALFNHGHHTRVGAVLEAELVEV